GAEVAARRLRAKSDLRIRGLSMFVLIQKSNYSSALPIDGNNSDKILN
ncbi:uncharacterized protein METZ01_LOCUS500748, partial [marine metagenome]